MGIGVTDLKNAQIQRIVSKVFDMHGRQIKNGGNATDQQDFVTLAQLQDSVKGLTSGGGTGSTTNITNNTVPDGFSVLAIVSNAISINIDSIKNFKVTLNQSTKITVNNPTATSIVPGSKFDLIILTDGTIGRPTPGWDTDFAPDVTNKQIDPKASTRSIYSFCFEDDSLWHIKNFRTGDPA